MSFTADEYETAARVLRSVGTSDTTAVPALEELAKAEEKRQAYALNLGLVAPTNTPESRGRILLAKLHLDGWKAPEGLL